MSRVLEFQARSGASDPEQAVLAEFVAKTTFNPYSIAGKRDDVGEWYAILRRTGRPGDRVLAAGYRIDDALRQVDVINIEAYPDPKIA